MQLRRHIICHVNYSICIIMTLYALVMFLHQGRLADFEKIRVFIGDSFLCGANRYEMNH
jgi:hypothetical protein